MPSKLLLYYSSSTKGAQMTQHSSTLSDFLHGLKRMFEPGALAAVSPPHGADDGQPLIQEVKNLELALNQLRQRAAELRPATSASQLRIQESRAEEQQAIESVILALHEQLQTHVALEEIQEAQELMRELDAVGLGKSGRNIEQRLKAAAINRLGFAAGRPGDGDQTLGCEVGQAGAEVAMVVR